MRVSTSFIHAQGLQAILDQQTALVRTQSQLSTGKKNLVPSDDPSGSTRVINLDASISKIEQQTENAAFATQRLNQEEATLNSVMNVIQRTRVLSLQAANTAVNDINVQKSIAAELQENLNLLFDFANSRDADGEYIFSGFQSKTQAFTKDAQDNFIYNGDQGQMLVQVGDNRQVAVNDSGAKVFQNIRTGNGVFTADVSRTNSGTGKIGTGVVQNPGAYQAQDFTITFTAADTFDVVNNTTGATVLAAQTYTDGSAIAFNGLAVEITGTPSIGDSFTVEASRNQDVFTTMSNLINDMTVPGAGNFRGSLGGDYLVNGFDVGDTVTFDLVFDGQTINVAHTVGGADTNATISAAILADIAADANVTANPDGSFTLAGTTANTGLVFRAAGTDIAFESFGGTGSSINSLVVNNVTDDDASTAGNNAALDLIGGGNSLVTTPTVTVGGTTQFLAGPGNSTLLTQQIGNALNNLDQIMSNIINVQTSIGGRLNSIDTQVEENESKELDLIKVRSDIEDLDFAEAISNFTFQTTALQAAQQSFVQIQNLSLFNFI